jgi:hypothetical protein
VSIGLVLFALGPLILGLLGWLSALNSAFWVLGLTILALPNIGSVFHSWGSRFRTIKLEYTNLFLLGRVGVLICCATLLLALIIALAPPIGYDALIYHLAAPAQFLESHRIQLLPENWPANGPLLPQMLYSFGIAVGFDSAARVFNLSWLILILLSVYAFGRRFSERSTGFIAAVIILGIPIVPIWGTLAYGDFAWGFFEFTALSLWIIWTHHEESLGTLLLSGVFLGLSLSSKYLAWGQFATLLIMTFLFVRKSSVRKILICLGMLTIPALLVSSPWYLKNLILSGNPLFPLILGGPGWPPERIRSLTEYHRSFSTGHRFIDFLLLPINIYRRYERFGTFGGSIEIPTPLFLFGFAFPWVKRSKPMNLLSIATLIRMVFWAITSQQIRHLIPLYPALALIAAHVLVQTRKSISGNRFGHVLQAGLCGGMLVTSFVYMNIYLFQVRPVGVLVGTESKVAFLGRNVHDFGATTFIQEELPSTANVLFLWDAQSYYCDEKCIPDADHNQWTAMVDVSMNQSDLCERLEEREITHLLFSEPDATFRLNHDPDGRQRRALEVFIAFRHEHLLTVYQDAEVSVLEVDCY